MQEIVHSNWFFYIEIAYIILVILVALRVIYDSNSSSKAIAYLLLIFFFPIFGIFFYFSFGVNYRKRKIFSKKLKVDEALAEKFDEQVKNLNLNIEHRDNQLLEDNKSLIQLLTNSNMAGTPLLECNQVELLQNGEVFFPKLIEDLKNAKKFIHIEYYIFEGNHIGNEIADILIQKAEEGVEVRFIYDDFGSYHIRNSLVKRLKSAGVEAYPFNKIMLIALANSLNYRNHRKIVVIDGKVGYTGGINISDSYDNRKEATNDYFWRDTHLRIDGTGAYGLQYIFLCDWNFASKQNLGINSKFFPKITKTEDKKTPVQIISSGPDSEMPGILYSVLESINNAKSEILITTPYFIPEDSLQQALVLAAMAGKKVKLLLPGVTDSKFVKIASESYYEELLKVGVEIYLYKKGFIHAKTFVTDSGVSAIGTCNLDFRSFDLNLEVNAMIYDEEFAKKMQAMFHEDCKYAEKLEYENWNKRPKWHRLKNSFIRLFSSLL